MTGVGVTNWAASIRNAICVNQFDWVDKWIADPKNGYHARDGMKDYEEFMNGIPNKTLQSTVSDHERMMFKKYKEHEAMRDI